MVLSSAADSEQPSASPSQPLMAASGNSRSGGATTAPFKPLHNFPLEDLRWSMSRHSRRGDDPPAPEEERKKPSKFFVRLRGKRLGNPANDGATPPPPCPAGGGDDDDDVAAETKTWNLRPRRAVTNPNRGAGEVGPTGGGGGEAKKEKDKEKEKEEEKRERIKEEKRERGRVRRERLKEEKEKKKKKKKKKRNSNTNTNNEKESEHERGISFAIPLTKDEIEHDFFAFAGSRPSRRPKKRPRHIQKQLDSVFPGLWLNSITPESYEVDEPQSKPRK